MWKRELLNQSFIRVSVPKKHIQENVVVWDFSFCSEKLIAVNGEAIWMHVADR
jgi:hypothetical protein